MYHPFIQCYVVLVAEKALNKLQTNRLRVSGKRVLRTFLDPRGRRQLHELFTAYY
jgi:hypothetical protein